MSKSVKTKIGWIVIAVLILVLINGVLFHFYPGNFSIFAYILFLFIPLAAAIAIIFTRFSLLFIKNIEEEKEESLLLQERQKEIVENMVEGLIVHNLNGKILTLNAVAEKFLGMKMSNLRGKRADELRNSSHWFNILLQDFKEGEILEYSVTDKSGQVFDYQIIKITLNKERGEILKIIRDVTRSKYLDRMKTEYVTIMSHKFLTPLTNIKWSADSLLSGEIDAKRKEENVKNILSNAERLVKLTSYLLNIAEIEEGLFGYNFEKLDMNAVIEDVIQNYSEESRKKGVKIIYHKPKEDSYFVRGDKNKLNVAVSNYLDNSIKYTPQGGKVEILMEESGSELKVSVADSGIGISPESVQSLFSKFFRDERARAVHTEGSGIGLFIVKNIIEEHGGKVGYSAGDGKGSTFFLTLPLYKENKNISKDLK
ncbi:MAG: Phosphate regulon sensor protein PhoR (SphS) [Parcubacteria group bacterium]|nr:Phosphate regulon sensor protein PhoR (SphS) [Parcubacteria group bacterium]